MTLDKSGRLEVGCIQPLCCALKNRNPPWTTPYPKNDQAHPTAAESDGGAQKGQSK